MKVLITGSTGQVGSALQACAPAEFNLITPARNEFDLAQPDSLTAALEQICPDAILNCGSYTDVEKAESDAECARIVNAKAPGVIAAYTAKHSIPLIHISSDFVFNGKKGAPYMPGDDCDPLNSYGASKLGGEQAVRSHDADAYILRSSWIYADHGTNFVLKMLELAAARDQLSIVEDQTGTPCYAPHLAVAIWRLLAVRPASRLLHFADSGAVSRYDFAREIFRVATDLGLLKEIPELKPVGSAEFPAAALRPGYSALDSTNTEAELQITAQPWQEGLATMLRNQKPEDR